MARAVEGQGAAGDPLSPPRAGARGKRRARRPVRPSARRWLRAAREELWAREPAGEPAAGGRWRRAVAGHLLPLVAFAMLAVGVTYPLVLHYGTHLPSDGGDALQNYWNYWWFGEALRAGRNPYWTPLFYAPYGAPLYLHTLTPFNGLLALPLGLAIGPIPAYNTLVLLSLTLAGYFASLLVGHVSGSRAAGFAGGVIYAFGAYHLAHLPGHMNLLASEWLPAFLLCLLLALGARGRRRTLLALAAAAALTLTMLCDWQYVVFAILAAGWLAGCEAIRRRSLAPIVVAAAIGLLWAIVAAPLIVPTAAQVGRSIADFSDVTTVEQARAGATVLPDEGAALRYSADLVSFFVPAPGQPWWGAAAERLGGRATAPPNERALFLGYLPLALAAIGVWRARGRAAPWLGLGLIAFALALGPTLQVLGEPATLGGREVALPFRLLQEVPAIGIVRVPARYGLLVALSGATLAGLGLAGLKPLAARWRWGGGGVARAGRGLLFAALIGAILAEQITVPIALEAPDVPPFYAALGRSAEPGVVMEWPFCRRCAYTNYYQTIHRRPVIGGYISRRLDYPIRNLPPYLEYSPPSEDIFARGEMAATGRWALRHSGVRWIVVYTDQAPLDEPGTALLLARYAEPTPLYADERMAVFRPLPPSGPDLFLQAGDGWHAPEGWAPGRGKMRWFAERGVVGAWNFADAPQGATLRFNAWSFGRPRRLEVWFDGQRLGEWTVGDLQPFALPLTLAPGPHRIELRALDPPLSPASLGQGSNDARPLAIGVAEMRLDGP